MKRYYLCDIIGDGDADAEPTLTTGPYRPAVADMGVSWSGLTPSGPDGRPKFTWCLVVVEAKNHAVLRDAPGIDALPDFPLDGKVNAIQAATKNAMVAALTRRSIPTDFVGNADGYRDVVRGIGRVLHPTFDEDTLDVS